MGIETDPIYWEYGDDCLACWAAGLTPLYLFASFSGIQPGALWQPGDPAPPNGLFVLEQVAPCRWESPTNGIPVAGYDVSPPGSSLAVFFGAIPMFIGVSVVNCTVSFANTLAGPNAHYTGGQGLIFQREPGSSAPSLADIMELLNMDGRESRKSEVFPVDNQYLVVMLADLVESTRIRIKYDFT